MATTARARQPLTSDQRNAFLAALLGWTMDVHPGRQPTTAPAGTPG